MKVKIKKLDPSVETPRYAHKGDACFDLAILINNNKYQPKRCKGSEMESLQAKEWASVDSYERNFAFDIFPGQSVIFHTGLAFEIPEGYVMRMYVRSSTGIKSRLILSNGTGIIDSGYRGEVRIALANISNDPVRVTNGQRIAQCEIAEVLPVEFEEAEELSTTERGTGGIGSTEK